MTAGSYVERPFLNSFATGFGRNKYKADILALPVKLQTETCQYEVQDDNFRQLNTQHEKASDFVPAAIIKTKTTKTSMSTYAYKKGALYNASQINQLSPAQQMQQMMIESEKPLIDLYNLKEYHMVTAFTTATNYDTNMRVTLSGTNQFDHASCIPNEIINFYAHRMNGFRSKFPTDLCFSAQILDALRKNADVIKYIGLNSGYTIANLETALGTSAFLEFLKAYFNTFSEEYKIERIHIHHIYVTKENETAPAQLWGNYISMFHQDSRITPNARTSYEPGLTTNHNMKLPFDTFIVQPFNGGETNTSQMTSNIIIPTEYFVTYKPNNELPKVGKIEVQKSWNFPIFNNQLGCLFGDVLGTFTHYMP